MGIIQVLSKLQGSMELKKNPLFQVPVEKQRSYISRFPEPKDDLQRSYFQYRAQAMLRGRFMNSAVSAASFPVTLLMLLKYRRAAAPEKAEALENRAVFFRDGKPANIMPNVLREEFSECVTDPVEGSLLLKEDLSLVWELIRRYPLSWQLVLKCVIKIARYRYAIEKYAPKALIVCNEYSFTSSVLTEFCQRNGVELVNVMHGEKLYYIRESFFRFHRCFVWDARYASLFTRLRAAGDQFRVAVPESLRFRLETTPEKCYDYTYYLGAEDKDALIRLHGSLTRLQAGGASVNVRPHPRYTDKEVLRKLYQDIAVEDTSEVTIETSVMRSRAVISQFSTVLLQASCNGIDIVIDDLTDPDQHAKLLQREYVMLDKPHKKLSMLIGGDSDA